MPDTQHYCDYAASAPPFPRALEATAECAAAFPGNPSSTHTEGRAARAELERLRERLRTLAGQSRGRLILTAGGTEANNLILQGIMTASSGRLLLAPDAHASARFALTHWPGRVDLLPLDAAGRLTTAAVAGRLAPDTMLCTISHASNETGVIHDVAAIREACATRGVPCHVDGTQALGHIPVDLDRLAPDAYVFSAHKFGGPRGVGGIFTTMPDLPPLLAGGGQEGGERSGTENLSGLAGAVAALEESGAILAREPSRLRALAVRLRAILAEGIPGALVNGDPDAGLPGFLSVSLPDLIGSALVTELDLRGFSISAGSACHADSMEPSQAILALGRAPAEALGTVRISLGRSSTDNTVEALGRTLVEVARRQRALS